MELRAEVFLDPKDSPRRTQSYREVRRQARVDEVNDGECRRNVFFGDVSSQDSDSKSFSGLTGRQGPHCGGGVADRGPSSEVRVIKLAL
ncbi:hypothetical protein HS1genome_1822 [Sulfodiicoccus acidiphilus]|uniref:Uncharacterized protein n=1 Tax=Sulfodiicoccus acidiphilus TaxID=1670455 RepID=A0A348B5I1_9CREN|nr:hypothetical protein [Sulfodiicoccus acidiphilus]BBD73433.1 hypothetical protein HS1genome_1822 [Sulfodiicoccus acidiphilus]GGT98573.1 hypothetical protein GCM10007116_14970 [Sulfodiicoccus acidiphilus]